ncbi:flagella synthesis protein FlgN [Zymobacter palmae]|uniref:Flagellar biosynthesis/type III secretory n=1 Tax=Zymobacter palmae TaxID=33074 RepID=A0A348HFI1_9GAMM|nr:flagellar export chaperone FlgN [Zymobacter palmae]BBG30383.1 flagellar biosynthesis/type III secretory [Zymobacter palmae]
MTTARTLSHALEQMSDALAELRVLMRREHELFAHANIDIAALSEITQQKAQLLGQLETFEQQRREVIEQQGFNGRDRDASLAAADAIGEGERWQDILEVARQVKSMNAVSATIIEERSRIERQLMKAIRPEESEPLYGASGRPQRHRASRYRVVG